MDWICFKVNPRNARRFAEALGVRAKTDSADAAMLACMGVALDLAPHALKREILSDLSELVAVRQALIKDRRTAHRT